MVAPEGHLLHLERCGCPCHGHPPLDAHHVVACCCPHRYVVPKDCPECTKEIAMPVDDDYLTITNGKDDQWYWRRQAANHEVISSGEGYTEAGPAVDGAQRANPDIPLDRTTIVLRGGATVGAATRAKVAKVTAI